MYKMIFTTYNMIKGIDVYNKIIRIPVCIPEKAKGQRTLNCKHTIPF